MVWGLFHSCARGGLAGPATSITTPPMPQHASWTAATGAPRAVVIVPHARMSRHAHRKMLHARIRKKLSGSSDRPRLAVFKSNQYLYTQVIDDDAGHTLAAISTRQPDLQEALREKAVSFKCVAAAAEVGRRIAELCRWRGITQVRFDRGGYPYHGRVKAIADAAREAGLEF